MINLQEKLNFLLDKYDVNKKVSLADKETVIMDGKKISLLPWRCERRFIELKNLVNDGSLKGISVMRVCRIDNKDKNLNTLLYREIDLCEWILGSTAVEIFSIANGNAMNVVAKLKSGVVCTIEVATTLSKELDIVDKHEIIAQKGVACDRVVDTQVPQSSIYVFTDKDKPDTYQDVDAELYGLSIDEVAIVRQAFEIAKSDDLVKELIDSAKHLTEIVNLSDKSLKTVSNIAVV